MCFLECFFDVFKHRLIKNTVSSTIVQQYITSLRRNNFDVRIIVFFFFFGKFCIYLEPTFFLEKQFLFLKKSYFSFKKPENEYWSNKIKIVNWSVRASPWCILSKNKDVYCLKIWKIFFVFKNAVVFAKNSFYWISFYLFFTIIDSILIVQFMIEFWQCKNIVSK